MTEMTVKLEFCKDKKINKKNKNIFLQNVKKAVITVIAVISIY